MVVKLGEGCPDVHQFLFQHTPAQVAIAVGEVVVPIKTAYLLEYLFTHHQAGGCTGSHVVGEDEPSAITNTCPVIPLMPMARDFADAHDNPRVLDGVIGEEQFCTHSTHSGAHRVNQHFFQPIRRNDLHIVVEEQENLAAGFIGCEVIGPGIVEGFMEFQNLHPLILAALQTVIQGIGSDVTVVGVDSAAGARATLRDDPGYDLVLLDLALGGADGFDLLAEFRQAYPAVPVVVVSASDRASDVIRAIDLGAMGFVPKRSSQGELHEALRMVMAGSMYVPPSMLGLDFAPGGRSGGDSVPDVMRTSAPPLGPAAEAAPLGAAARPEPHQKLPSIDDVGLTPRQAEVLSLLLQGLPNKLIARQLNLSVETVKDHVAAVLRALGVSSRTQAVLAVSQMTQGQGGFFARRPPR